MNMYNMQMMCSPRLTWRDLQHIVVRTARKANLVADDWVKNAVGRLGSFVRSLSYIIAQLRLIL